MPCPKLPFLPHFDHAETGVPTPWSLESALAAIALNCRASAQVVDAISGEWSPACEAIAP
jgi:hypothetical protein